MCSGRYIMLISKIEQNKALPKLLYFFNFLHQLNWAQFLPLYFSSRFNSSQIRFHSRKLNSKILNFFPYTWFKEFNHVNILFHSLYSNQEKNQKQKAHKQNKYIKNRTLSLMHPAYIYRYAHGTKIWKDRQEELRAMWIRTWLGFLEAAIAVKGCSFMPAPLATTAEVHYNSHREQPSGRWDSNSEKERESERENPSRAEQRKRGRKTDWICLGFVKEGKSGHEVAI